MELYFGWTELDVCICISVILLLLKLKMWFGYETFLWENEEQGAVSDLLLFELLSFHLYPMKVQVVFVL